ncbi:MAG TPA: peptidoglycan DD-metalloendopeptidase family protein [Acidiphilium sp.]|nr:peptidoglycan DD-metalloendopeptidase family protein [Acidiphilium sp.]
MPLAARRLVPTAALLVAALAAGAARADQLGTARNRLDQANAAAQRHRAAAAAAARAEAAAASRRRTLLAREIAANAALRAAEDKTAQIVSQLADLGTKTEAARVDIEASTAAIAPLLPIIIRLARRPAATLIAAGSAPGKAAEGALAMQGITRQIAAKARELLAAQQRYAALSLQLREQKARMIAAVAQQKAGDAALQAAIAATAAAESLAERRRYAEARQAASAASQAHDLVGVINRLERARAAAARAAAAREAAARISPPAAPKILAGAPVAGRLIRAFASTTATGPATGDTFAASPGAVVSAPCGGGVVFARPFASYGKLMIIDCGGGYDFVMAGFQRFDVSVGQHVQPGQPVGRMPAFDTHNPGNQPRLYVELRHDGKAVDPAARLGAGTANR